MYKIPIEGEIYKHKQATIKELDTFEVETEFMEQIFDMNSFDRNQYPLRFGEQNLIFR